MDEIYFDATDCIAGRMASVAAKELLKGRRVHIVNAEKAVISGDPTYTISLYRHRRDRGDPYHGPFTPRQPDRLLRRMVRGMLPYKKSRGRDALKELRVHCSLPREAEGKSLRVVCRAAPDTVAVTLQKLSERI